MKNKLLIIIVLMLSMPVKGDCKFENGNGLLTGIWRSPVTKTNSVCPSVEKTLKLTPLRRSKLTPFRRSKLTPLKKC